MQIRILIGDKSNVDFGSHIEMNSEDYEKFIKLMESLFKPIEKEENKLRSWRMGEEERIQYPHPWTPAEIEVLLNSSSIEDAVNKLGRSGMSIIVRSGIWEYEYYSWCEKKGKNWNSIETIKEFLKEQKNEILERRKIRVSKNRIKKINKNIEEKNSKIIELRKKKEKLEFTSIGKEAERDIQTLEKEIKLLEKEKLELSQQIK